MHLRGGSDYYIYYYHGGFFMYEEYLDRLKNEGIIRNRKEGTIETYTACVNKFLNLLFHTVI